VRPVKLASVEQTGRTESGARMLPLVSSIAAAVPDEAVRVEQGNQDILELTDATAEMAVPLFSLPTGP
jgi:hypothetical protein